jgi:hypothetical protein
MNKKDLLIILKTCYNDHLDIEAAWNCYCNLLQVCYESDQKTINYLHTLAKSKKPERLRLRNRIAEKGYELTPNELNQYLLMLALALAEINPFKIM